MSCPDCVKGSIHDGKPKGTETKIGGVNAYVTGPEDAARVVVIGADIFGWRFVNTRLLADEYAARGGFRVVVPDFFSGWELPTWTLTSLTANSPGHGKAKPSLFQRFVAQPASLFVLVPFVLRNMPRQVATIARVTNALRAGPDTKSETKKAAIRYVGFCWGGRFAISQNHLFDASVACHPSLVRFPAELEGVRKPFSLAVAAADPQFDAARAKEAERILEEERGLKEVEVRVYEGVNHGWTTRADLNDAVQKKARDDAVEQVVGWFEKYLVVETGSHADASVDAPATEATPSAAPAS